MIMDAKNNQQGQALIEFVLFVPFLLLLYFSILSMSNAINGSINQQKITRAYFYYRAANNSTIPKPIRDGEPSDAWSVFGMEIIGWADRFETDSPVAPCYKYVFPIEVDGEDSCERAYSQPTTQFIRVQTVYGVCGATYTKDGTNRVRHPSPIPNTTVAVGSEACLIVN